MHRTNISQQPLDDFVAVIQSLSHDVMDAPNNYPVINEKIALSDNRRVSFPDNQEELVTGYLEPANPWGLVKSVTSTELSNIYKQACIRNKVDPIPRILNHIRDVDFTSMRCSLLCLSGVWLPAPACEALEELLRRVQYSRIELAGCGLTDDTAVSMFDMIEYYESANELDISENIMLGLRGWEACGKMIRNTQCLTTLEARFTPMKEAYVARLCRGLRDNSSLCVLKLENCALSGQGITVLAGALKLNGSLKELWIANNELVTSDALQLANLLKTNLNLQLLDISNNQIEDSGLAYISEALVLQAHRIIPKEQLSDLSEINSLPYENEFTPSIAGSEPYELSGIIIKNRSPPVSPSSSISSTQSLDDSLLSKQFNEEYIFNKVVNSHYIGEFENLRKLDQFHDNSTLINRLNNRGLSVLIMWNNKLTNSSAEYIDKILDIHENMEILNIGQNDLTDEVLSIIKMALKKNTTLLCLGLQSTQLSCKGVQEFTDILTSNHTLKRIDLRGNNIKLDGLKCLMDILESNYSISQIDLDENPKRLVGPDLSEYQELVHRIKNRCMRNDENNLKACENKPNVNNVIHKNNIGKDNVKKINRKISLTCQQPTVNLKEERNNFLEPRGKVSGRLRSPLPSPIPSPSSSPTPSPSRHRFQVSKVSEISKITAAPNSNSSFKFRSPTSRFRVTLVDNSDTLQSKPFTETTTVNLNCSLSDQDSKHTASKSLTVNVSDADLRCDLAKSNKSEKTIISNNSVSGGNKNNSINNSIDDYTEGENVYMKNIYLRNDKSEEEKEYINGTDLEISNFIDTTNRSNFGSASSLDASISSIDSISGNDRNISPSSNDSFELESNKFNLITNDSLDLAKSHINESISSGTNFHGTSIEGSNLSKTEIRLETSIFNTTEKSPAQFNTEFKENITKLVRASSSDEKAITNSDKLSWTKGDAIKNSIRKISWVPPQLESWIFDDQKSQSGSKSHISKSDTIAQSKVEEKESIDDCKLPSSLDKLLTIFQHPAGLFMRNTLNLECNKITAGKRDEMVHVKTSNSFDKFKDISNLLVTTDNDVSNVDNQLIEPLKKNNCHCDHRYLNEFQEISEHKHKLHFEQFSTKMISGIKDNVSPESAIVTNIKSITLSQLIDNVNKQGSTIDNLKGVVESVSNYVDDAPDSSFEDKIYNDLAPNELNANLSIEVKINSVDNSEIVDCVNASEILDNEMKSNINALSDNLKNDLISDTNYAMESRNTCTYHTNRNESLENTYPSISNEEGYEDSTNNRITANIIEM